MSQDQPAGPVVHSFSADHLGFRKFCRREKLPHPERSWDAWQDERYRRGERGTHPGYTENP